MENTKKQTRLHSSSLIESLLAEITPAEHERTLNQMMMSARIEDGIIAKGWSKGEFAKQIGQTPSTISKWLSGSHNFTLDTLTDIQRVLDIQLLCVKDTTAIKEADVRVVYKTKTLLKTKSTLNAGTTSYGVEYAWQNNQITA